MLLFHSLSLSSVGKVVALDCEMVGTGHDGSYSMLARACIVNHHGYTLYDTFVAPMDKITDYRTAISGVSPKDISRGTPTHTCNVHRHFNASSSCSHALLVCVIICSIAPDFHVVQEKVSNLLRDRILVGHSVQNDLKVRYENYVQAEFENVHMYICTCTCIM